MSIYGNPIMLGASGGSSGIPLLSRVEWNALSTAQKQAYGLVAVQDANSGFDQGELYYGANYIPIGEYIPNSDNTKIICEAFVENFSGSTSAESWGDGTHPITMQYGLNPIVDAGENAVYLGISATGKFAYVDLGATAAPYTAYIVAKLVSPGTYTRVLSSMAARNSGQGMLLYGSTINVSSWASDTNTGVSSSSYFAAALQYDGTQTTQGHGIVGSNGSYISKNPVTSSQYLAIGRTDIDSSSANAEPANMYVRYFAVTTAYESESTIKANLANLESVFIN